MSRRRLDLVAEGAMLWHPRGPVRDELRWRVRSDRGEVVDARRDRVGEFDAVARIERRLAIGLEQPRVDERAVPLETEVQMRPGREPGRAHVADDLFLPHR